MANLSEKESAVGFAMPGWRQVAVLAALSVVLGLTGIRSPEDGPVDRCDVLSAAAWDMQKPRQVTGVAFDAIDDRQAFAACKDAVDRDFDNSRFHFQLGRVYQHRGDDDLADFEYLLSLLNDGSYAAPVLGRGMLYETGRMAAAARPPRQPHVDRDMAFNHYRAAALLGLPAGHYCYAKSLLADPDPSPSDRLLALRELQQARQGAIRPGIERDDALIRTIDRLTGDLRAARPMSAPASCDLQQEAAPGAQ